MNLGFIPAKHAALSPSRTALVDVTNQKRMTYGELDRRVRRLANALVRELGLQKGARVANLSKNSAEYLECYYACARVGLVTQPLNWRLGEEEVGFWHGLDEGYSGRRPLPLSSPPGWGESSTRHPPFTLPRKLSRVRADSAPTSTSR